jgi:hypothetical protein
MQVITNERRYKRGRFMATVFSISGLLMLLSATIATLTLNLAISSFPLLLVGVATSLIGIRLSNRWVRPPVTHEALTNALKGIGKDAVLLNYWGPSNHILIHPQGIFALTTRTRPFDLNVDDQNWHDRASAFTKFQRFMSQDALGWPIRDAQNDAKRASAWLEKKLDLPISVQPIIVFLHPSTRLDVQEQPSVPVTYADKRKPSLKSYLKQDDPTSLQPEQLQKFIAAITNE